MVEKEIVVLGNILKVIYNRHQLDIELKTGWIHYCTFVCKHKGRVVFSLYDQVEKKWEVLSGVC